MPSRRRTSQRKLNEAIQKSFETADEELISNRDRDGKSIGMDLINSAPISSICEEPFQCGVCSTGFPNIELLSSHVCEHDMIEKFQCNICNEIFSTSDALSFHLDGHKDIIKPFKCGICNAGYIDISRLLAHITENHDQVPPFYKCRVCSYSVPDISKLTLHIEEKHSSKYRCGICCKTFSQERELSVHVQTHTDRASKLSKCPICFSRIPASILANHIMTHNKEKNKTKVPNKSHGLVRTKDKEKRRHLKDSSPKGDTGNDIMGTVIFKNGRKSIENEIDTIEPEIEETNTEGEEAVYVKRGLRRKRQGDLIPKNNPIKIKPNPAIKDTNQLIASMRANCKNGNEVYDCDVCGIRVNDCDFFMQHRNDHFCDGKFCINCQHCSKTFDSFQELDDHIGPGKCSGYKCKTCGKSFSLEPALLTHVFKQHSSLTKQDGVYTCSICEKTFDNKTAYIRHASSHSEDKCIQCKLCRHAFTTQESLLGHLRTTHSIIPLTRKQYKYNCDICGANFMKDEALSNHQANVHNIGNDSNSNCTVKSNLKKHKTKSPDVKKKGDNKTTFKRTGHWRSAEDDVKRRTCPICHRVFERFKDVRRHIGTHTKPYLCSHCGKSFPYRYSLDAHTKAYHSAENPHKCETCNKTFSCERSLMIHRRIHTGEKPHQCHICHKSFRQVANLSMHIKLHSTDKPIKCHLCDYRCSHQGYLKRHMSTHSTEKKYMCPSCNKGFTEKPNLNHHLKRHSKVKNHVCAVCGHRFAERYYLNNHMRIHTREKPYVCPVCNRAFTMRPNMVSHIKKTHPSYNYQPIRPLHKQVSDYNPNVTDTDMNVKETGTKNTHDNQCHSMAETTSASKITAIMSSNGNAFNPIISNAMPTIAIPANSHPVTTLTPQLPQLTPQLPIQLQQPTQPASNVPISACNTELFYQQLTNAPAIVKLDTSRFTQAPPTPRDILVDFPQQPLQHQQTEAHHQQQQLQPVEPILQDTYIKENEIIQRGPVHQDLSEPLRHQYNVNAADRFLSSHFVDSQQILPIAVSAPQNQNFTTVPIANQSYMYTYPSVPPSDNLIPLPVQGFFTNLQTSNPKTTEQQKP